MKWYYWLMLPIMIPLLLMAFVIVAIVSGFVVAKQIFWPDSLC